MPGDAEPRVSADLTAPEQQLLALIREGRVDAEIAVRLGIGSRDAKERVERLSAKLGVRRAELRNGPPDGERPALPEQAPGPSGAPLSPPVPPDRLPPLVAGLAVLLVTALIAIRFLWPASAAPAPSPGPTSPVAVATPATASSPLQTVPIAGHEMIDLGPFFATFSPGAISSVKRGEDSLAVTYSGRLYLPVSLIRVTSHDAFQLNRFSESETEIGRDTPIGPVRLTLRGSFGRDRDAVQKGAVSFEPDGTTGRVSISAELADGPGCCQSLPLAIVGGRLYLGVPPPQAALPTVRVAGRDMVDLGPAVSGPPGAAFRAEAREELLVFEPSGGMLLDLSGWQLISASLSGFEAVREFGGRPFYLSGQASGASIINRGGPGLLFAVTSFDGKQPALALWAGPSRGTPGLHLELDSMGRLYVDAAPSAFERAVETATGEALDVSAATIAGTAPLSGGSIVVNDCLAAGTCQAFVYADSPEPGDEYILPGGTVTCRDGDALSVGLGAFSLYFQEVERTGPDHGDCLPLATQYFNNDGSFHPPHVALSYTTSYRITARTADGRPLSVVIANDRTIYVGEITAQYGCPCRTAN